MKIINDQPFEHHCGNGSRFYAQRCDFVGGLYVDVPAHLSEEQFAEDAFSLGWYHATCIVPYLNGFTGPPIFIINRV